MKTADIVIWDIETGGFKKEENGLVEIAMIVIDSTTLEEIDRYEAIIAPYEQANGEMSTYTTGAEKIHGISMKQIENGRDAKEVAKEIKAFCLKYKKTMRGGAGKLIPSGHKHTEFDIPWLKIFLSLFKVDFNELFNAMGLDTLLWTRLKWGRDGSIANHKLETACQQSGIELIDAHRAMADTEANTELVRAFIRSLRMEGQKGQIITKSKFRTSFSFN